ncbi:ABC-2 family transporter protein [Paenibacillus sp. HB172176]|uniref:ABC transporter permease n=1 Tax=Paenibacillus sp. HB172176 TaxID=2493690 RepID=UPI0014388B0F|nr:ABC-2 family transporter protein [Paenibacillus sp. HB172176]
MSKLLKQTRRYLSIYWLLCKNSFMAEMEYRINFLFGAVIEIAYLAIKLLYVLVVYRAGVKVNGLTPDGILLCVGSFTFMTGIYSLFFYSNFTRLPGHIRNGTLDMMMTKPVSLQFLATLQRLNFGFSSTNIVAGIIIIVIAWKRLELPLTLANIGMYTVFTFCGIVLNYVLFLLPSLLTFWTVQSKGINEASTLIWEMNHMPMNIYGKSIQFVGSFLLPVFLISNYSPFYVLERLSIGKMLWGLAAPVLFLIVSRLLWKRALRSYTSASS